MSPFKTGGIPQAKMKLISASCNLKVKTGTDFYSANTL